MDLQRILNSQQAGSWALRISRMLPPAVGLQFAKLLASRLTLNRDLPLMQAIRLNRWVTSDFELEGAALDRAARQALYEIAASFYLLFHYINRPEALQELVEFSPEVDEVIALSRENRRGLLVAGLHMSNFDLVIQAAAWRGLRAIAVSLPEVTENQEAVEWQHQFRRQAGLEILPASVSTFKKAVERLRAGGVVMTGIDRSISKPRLRPKFFGQPAWLPLHHVHLALEADVPLLLISALRKEDGRYHLLASPELRLEPRPNRDERMLLNAERVLEIAEGFVRQAPEQWTVVQPVWPDLLKKMP
ncbi:MAG: hypothetical protein IT297_07290 [Anaerolineae bacterium]|jgi:KDO2-lipid IV(A) lauroyltransferase|nr:hypothetical protein [Anaerolineae bacterium]MCZ7553431.1 hypothetical protein [Anaerolineales bacterium]